MGSGLFNEAMFHFSLLIFLFTLFIIFIFKIFLNIEVNDITVEAEQSFAQIRPIANLPLEFIDV